MIPALIIPAALCAQMMRSTLAIVVRSEDGAVVCAEARK